MNPLIKKRILIGVGLVVTIIVSFMFLNNKDNTQINMDTETNVPELIPAVISAEDQDKLNQAVQADVAVHNELFFKLLNYSPLVQKPEFLTEKILKDFVGEWVVDYNYLAKIIFNGEEVNEQEKNNIINEFHRELPIRVAIISGDKCIVTYEEKKYECKVSAQKLFIDLHFEDDVAPPIKKIMSLFFSGGKFYFNLDESSYSILPLMKDLTTGGRE